MENLQPSQPAVTESPTFQYERFWNDRIEAKKKDHSYRVFRNVERNTVKFPFAHIVEEKNRKEIQVWCSNDYMGMSWHPHVRESVK